MSLFLHEMVQDFARDAARIITCIFLQELVQDCARIVQEKGHIACTCQASLACKILVILQVRFCWAYSGAICIANKQNLLKKGGGGGSGGPGSAPGYHACSL